MGNTGVGKTSLANTFNVFQNLTGSKQLKLWSISFGGVLKSIQDSFFILHTQYQRIWTFMPEWFRQILFTEKFALGQLNEPSIGSRLN